MADDVSQELGWLQETGDLFRESEEVQTHKESPRLQEATSGPDRQWCCSLLHQLCKALVFTCMFCGFLP